jgi:SAM-dependent methyltransferase
VSEVVKNAWEFQTDEQALLALAGHSTREEFDRDREERAREVAGLCEIGIAERGFEIGSGEGSVARLLAGQCQALDCSDISESFLEVARKNCAGVSNVTFHKISNYLDHLPSGAYDFGYSLNVFIHFNPYDIFNYLQAVRRILKQGGIFYFDACTLGEQTMELFREQAAMYRETPQHVRGYLNFNHSDVIRAIVREASLEVLDKSYLSGAGWLKVLVTKP